MKEKIKALIADNKIKEALQLLIQSDDTTLKDDAILTQSRLKRLEKKYRGGLIKESAYTKKLNKISYDIISIISDSESENNILPLDPTSTLR